ncbi:nuclear transport factor 2 family protein, partial [Nonomuraea aridisoli]
MTDHRTDLTQLIHRLYATLDEARFDDLHTVFTPDATVRTAGGLAQGRDAVIAQATRTHATERTQHLVTNTLIDLDGDHATIRADLLVTFTHHLSLIHISEPTRLALISYSVFCLKKKKPQEFINCTFGIFLNIGEPAEFGKNRTLRFS